MLKILVLLSSIMTAGWAQAYEITQSVCYSQGNHVGGNDGGSFTGDSRLSLVLTKGDDGVLSLDALGLVMVASSFDKIAAPTLLNPDNSYIGVFRYGGNENLNYRPTVYRGYAQFKDFDAIETVGRESGMWGDLVIEKDYLTKKKFKAVYIFQAGDHMGGSLFFSCQKSI